MAAVPLQVEAPKYSRVIPVETGGKAELMLCIQHSQRFDDNPMHFLVRYEEEVRSQPKLRVLRLLVTEFADVTALGNPRTEWKLRGFVMDDEFDLGVGGGQVRHARFELEMSTMRRQGTLRILAHVQPTPIMEVIEWCQLVERINRYVKNRGGCVLEARNERLVNLKRGIVTGAEFMNDRFTIRCKEFLERNIWNEKRDWVPAPISECNCMVPNGDDCPKPIAFRDGRIEFRIPHEVSSVSFTIYPQTSIEW